MRPGADVTGRVQRASTERARGATGPDEVLGPPGEGPRLGWSQGHPQSLADQDIRAEQPGHLGLGALVGVDVEVIVRSCLLYTSRCV